jgi:hypothetical protein
MKEKEHLDIADTNTLLLHPSQFSITNPASPGNGGQNGRKTRYTRHRIDIDDMANGLSAEGGSHKRKRKVPIDNDDVAAASPSRDGISTPADRARAKAVAHQTGPLYSISSLFTEKELTFHTHQAHIATRHFFATSHSGNSNSNSNHHNTTNGHNTSRRARDVDPTAPIEPNSSPSSTPEPDDPALSAPEMDRTASQTASQSQSHPFHATRSTRTTGHPLSALNILSDLAEKSSVTRPGLPYATLYSHQPKTGTFLPSPSRLMQEEVDEDVAVIGDAMAQAKGWVDRGKLEEALKPVGVGDGVEGGRSSLAPDWPLYLDVHLVELARGVGGVGGPSR